MRLLIERRKLSYYEVEKAGVDEPQSGCILFSSFLLLRLSFPKSPGSLAVRQPGYLTLERPIGFAPPPHDGFAFLAAPSRRRCACVTLTMTGKEGVVKWAEGCTVALFTGSPTTPLLGELVTSRKLPRWLTG